MIYALAKTHAALEESPRSQNTPVWQDNLIILQMQFQIELYLTTFLTFSTRHFRFLMRNVWTQHLRETSCRIVHSESTTKAMIMIVAD